MKPQHRKLHVVLVAFAVLVFLSIHHTLTGGVPHAVPAIAQNGFGAIDIGHAVIDDSGLRATGMSGFFTAWDRHCGGKTGVNITRQVEVALRLSGAQ